MDIMADAGGEGTSDLRMLAEETRQALDGLLQGYGQRMSNQEVFMTATFVAGAYDDCQENGKSFRGWVRDHMNVSMPTAYKLVHLGHYIVKYWLPPRDEEEE